MFNEIWNEMKPAFDFLEKTIGLLKKAEETNLIMRWIDRCRKRGKDATVASGNSSKAASSGYSSTAASSGDYSKAASSGNSSTAASSGYSSTAASSGYSSTAASSGYSSTAASSGNSSKAASSGDYSKAASSGYSSTAASSGDYSKAASSGDYSKAASSGDYSKAASSGNSSTAASSGNYSKAECHGKHAACVAVGARAAVRGDLGNLLMCSEYKEKGNEFVPVGGFALMVDGKKIKADTWYICENGKPAEVDFTDRIFSRVISSKKVRGAVIKQIVIDGESEPSFVVIVGDKAAHGKTVEQAKKDLLYKISNRDTSAYKDWKLTDVKTAEEIIAAYRVITGACFYGTKSFCESIKLPKTATIVQAIEITRGQYGSEKFAKFFNK